MYCLNRKSLYNNDLLDFVGHHFTFGVQVYDNVLYRIRPYHILGFRLELALSSTCEVGAPLAASAGRRSQQDVRRIQRPGRRIGLSSTGLLLRNFIYIIIIQTKCYLLYIPIRVL